MQDTHDIDADKFSQAYVLGFQENNQKNGIKTIVNKINIGDSTGELYSFVSIQDKNTQMLVGSSFIIFRKNNIIVSVFSTPNVKVEPLLELARKQDEKISKLLDIFSASQDSSITQIKTPTLIQTSTSTPTPLAPTASIVAANNPDTPVVDLKIMHKGGDILKGGEWKLSIVLVGSPPDFIDSVSAFSVGNEIIAATTTERATGLTKVASVTVNDGFYTLNGVVPLSSGAKYDVKLVHTPSNELLLDQIVEVR